MESPEASNDPVIGARQLCSHWDRIYEDKAEQDVSWYAAHLAISVDLICRCIAGTSAAVIDVGCGRASLLQDLMALGYEDLTAVDISSVAIEFAKARLQSQSTVTQWLVADVLSDEFPRNRYDIWHDRAVFHFLTASGDRQTYIRRLKHSLRDHGYFIVGTFALNGPDRCSGLPTMRYSPSTLQDELGSAFKLKSHITDEHQTPSGMIQSFLYCVFEVVQTLPVSG